MVPEPAMNGKVSGCSSTAHANRQNCALIPSLPRSGGEGMRDAFLLLVLLAPEGKNLRPVVLHVDDRPAGGAGGIERLVEMADLGIAVVGPLANPIGVMHDETEAGPRPGGCPLQHL